MTRVRAVAVVVPLLCGLLGACGGASKPPCAAPIVALYTAEMIAAGCTGEHFDDPQCEPIKARRDDREAAAGCKP